MLLLSIRAGYLPSYEDLLSVTSLSAQTVVSCWNSNHRHIDHDDDDAVAAFLISVIATLDGWNGMQCPHLFFFCCCRHLLGLYSSDLLHVFVLHLYMNTYELTLRNGHHINIDHHHHISGH